MRSSTAAAMSLVVVAVLTPSAASAHCDTLDGPVVAAARRALDNGRIEPVLAWVRAPDEAEIRSAFASARAVRNGGKDARQLADRWFFETVVRVHRAGEGAPFTGLKPAGTPEPAVAAADRLVTGGDARELEALLVGAVRQGLNEHVARLKSERAPGADVAAGRRWVAAYVPFVHWAEAVHASATATGEHAAAHPAAAAAAEHAGASAEEASNEAPAHGGAPAHRH